jgi:hypothetical protein
MPNMDLEIAKETIAEVVDLIRTTDDISVEDVSRIVFSTLVDQVGEDLAENVLTSFSDDLATFIFQHDVIDIPDPIRSNTLDRLNNELEELVAQNMRGSRTAIADEQGDEEVVF